jgi:hypothetical protein
VALNGFIDEAQPRRLDRRADRLGGNSGGFSPSGRLQITVR